MFRKMGAFSLLEVLMAAVILVVACVPMIGVFLGSKDAVQLTDAARDVRYFVNEILAHVERQSLHALWDEFGPVEVVPEAGRMHHELAEYDAEGKLTGANPLGFDESFLRDLTRAGFRARVYFEFYTRKELEIQPAQPDPRQPDVASAKYGILHMQAGYVTVQIIDRHRSVINEWQQPIMCPAVVGRPGLKLASCPAVNKTVKAKYQPLLARREAQLQEPDSGS